MMHRLTLCPNRTHPKSALMLRQQHQRRQLMWLAQESRGSMLQVAASRQQRQRQGLAGGCDWGIYIVATHGSHSMVDAIDLMHVTEPINNSVGACV